MVKPVKLFVKETPGLPGKVDYVVIRIVNSTEWHIGQVLSHVEVKRLNAKRLNLTITVTGKV